MNNIKLNYQKELEKTLKQIEKENITPKLLLHSCCAPCSSYVLEYLSQYFDITIFYYNPNIYPAEEYSYRVEEQQKLISELKTKNTIKFVEGVYDTEKFYNMSKGMENIPEGGERCFNCYEMRLRETAEYALKNNFDYFTTTLTISPYKNAEKMNELGKIISQEKGIKYLFSDFKKKNGYRRSIELSEVYGLYRQDYCGCVFSKTETEKRRGEKNEI